MSKTAFSVTLCINGLITGLLVDLSLTITTAFESIMNPTKLEEKPKIIDYGLKRILDNWKALCNDHYYLFTTRIKNNNRKTFLLPTSKWTGRKGKHKCIINSQNPRKFAPYEIEATGTHHMMAPYLIFILKNCLKKEPSNRSVVDGKMDWVNSGWEIHQQISRKQNRINKNNNNFACASRFFVHFFALVARLRRETV